MDPDDEDAALAHQQELEDQERSGYELFRRDMCAWIAEFSAATERLERNNGNS